MIIDEVHILPTNTTPEVLLNPEGYIKIKGRAIAEDRPNFPEKIVDWIDGYLLNPAETTEVIIALEFLNSFNTIILTSILKKIALLIPQGHKLVVNWYYEEDDDDIFERGGYISSTLDIPISFITTRSISDF